MISLYLFQSYLLDAVFNVLATARRGSEMEIGWLKRKLVKDLKSLKYFFPHQTLTGGRIKSDYAMINWFHLKSKFSRILGHSQHFSRLRRSIGKENSYLLVAMYKLISGPDIAYYLSIPFSAYEISLHGLEQKGAVSKGEDKIKIAFIQLHLNR